MGHNSVVSGYPKSPGNPRVDELSIGPSGFGASQYLQVPIVLCPSHSLLPIYAGKYLYVVSMNNMIYEI